MAENINEEYFGKLAQTVIDGHKDECARLINEGLDSGMDPIDAIEKGLSKGIVKVGDGFGAGILFLPELIQAAEVMQVGVGILDKKIQAEGKTRKTLGKVVIGTVKGDIHDIGKSVVAAVLQANGYDVVDLGIDVENEAFVKAVIEHDADCVGMSSLLTLTIENMGSQDIIYALSSNDIEGCILEEVVYSNRRYISDVVIMLVGYQDCFEL